MKSIKVLGMALLGMSIIMASCSGEDGKDGLPGGKGDTGAKGDTGDTGDQGEQGVPGKDKPNVDFYFQDGFKGYDGTQDTYISETDVNDNFNNSPNGIRIGKAFLNLNRYAVLRFDGIDETMTSNLVGDGENCADAFDINQATLYLYLANYAKTGTGEQPGISLRYGFYNQDDPMFEQTTATWNKANADDFWFLAPGGESSFVGGLTDGMDDNTVQIQFNELAAGTGNIGWVAIPLPRSVVSNWICNPASNKGMRIRVEVDNVSSDTLYMDFLASESTNADLRPLLVIETEDVEPSATTKMAPSGKAQDWDNMSYEEKMAPLYRYFAAKGL